MKQKNPSWLTQNAIEEGLTLTVVKYLSGKLKNLNTVKQLTWKEFFYIYTCEGNAFKQSNFFKNGIAPFVSMKRKNKEQQAILQQIIQDVPEARSFFMQIIPVEFAIPLCENFWEAVNLWRNVKVVHEKRLILDKCLELFATCTINNDSIQAYWNITKDFPEDRKIVHGLIGSLIALNTYEAYYLAKKIPFTDNQMQALATKIKNDPIKKVGLEESLLLYSKTRHPLLIPVLDKIISEQNNNNYVIGRISDLIKQAKDSEQEFIKKSLFPVFNSSLEKVGFVDYFRNNGSHTVELLPVYEAGEPVVEGFLDQAIKYYWEHEYRLTYEYFIVWYQYAPKQGFIELYLDGLGRYGYKVFQGAIEVFQACNDSRVLDQVIEKELPKLTNPTEDLLYFIEWLEKRGDHARLQQFEKAILDGGYLEKWLKEVSGTNKNGMILYLKLAARFE